MTGVGTGEGGLEAFLAAQEFSFVAGLACDATQVCLAYAERLDQKRCRVMEAGACQVALPTNACKHLSVSVTENASHSEASNVEFYIWLQIFSSAIGDIYFLI